MKKPQVLPTLLFRYRWYNNISSTIRDIDRMTFLTHSQENVQIHELNFKLIFVRLIVISYDEVITFLLYLNIARLLISLAQALHPFI